MKMEVMLELSKAETPMEFTLVVRQTLVMELLPAQ
jgi:hypothetical protein